MKTLKKQNQSSSDVMFESIVEKLSSERGVTQGRMFGSPVLKIKGKVFTFPMKGKLVLKLPKERVEEIVASKKGVYFDSGHGRISKEWVAVAPSTQNEWFKLAQEAKDFVVQILK